jgi:peptide/nickel transport system permease protein
MGRYLLRRLLQALPVLLGITIITFTFMELAPGDAVSGLLMSAEGSAGTIDVEALRAKYGIDQPAPVRYLRWLGELLQGNFGNRVISGRPVISEILLRLPATVQLMAVAVLISVLVGMPLGIFSALRQYSVGDFALTGFVFLGISVPSFFAAIAGVYIFAVKLRWFPTGGYSTPGADLDAMARFLDLAHHMALPALVLAVEGSASIMRYTRASMLDVIRQDYITTARSKGLPPMVVTIRHALRNALLPVITIIGLRLPSLFGGAIVIEGIFNWPGMGRLYLEGMTARDIPLIMGMVLISAFVIVLSNLITDLTYALADPRVRYE